MEPQKQESTPRKDPEFRHVSGVRANEIEILNKDPNRHYVLVDEGAGQNREAICPEMYEEIGYKFERWPKFEGMKPEQLELAKQRALRFRGRPFGQPGEKMMARGHVLMSANAKAVKAMYAESQKRLNVYDDAINPEKAIARMRAEANPGRSKLELDLVSDKEMGSARRFDVDEEQR